MKPDRTRARSWGSRTTSDPRAVPRARHRARRSARRVQLGPQGQRASSRTTTRCSCRSRRCCGPSASRARRRCSTRSTRTTSSSPATDELSCTRDDRDRRQGRARGVPRRGGGLREARMARRRQARVSPRVASSAAGPRRPRRRRCTTSSSRSRARSRTRCGATRRRRPTHLELVVDHPAYAARVVLAPSTIREISRGPARVTAPFVFDPPRPLRRGRRRGDRLFRALLQVVPRRDGGDARRVEGGYVSLVMSAASASPPCTSRPTTRPLSATATTVHIASPSRRSARARCALRFDLTRASDARAGRALTPRRRVLRPRRLALDPIPDDVRTVLAGRRDLSTALDESGAGALRDGGRLRLRRRRRSAAPPRSGRCPGVAGCARRRSSTNPKTKSAMQPTAPA